MGLRSAPSFLLGCSIPPLSHLIGPRTTAGGFPLLFLPHPPSHTHCSSPSGIRDSLPSLVTRGLSETPAELQSPGRREGGGQRQRRPNSHSPPTPAPRSTPAPAPAHPGLASWPHWSSPVPVFSLLLLHPHPCHDSSTPSHSHPVSHSWDKAQDGRRIHWAEGEGWMEPEERVWVNCQGLGALSSCHSPAV